jgi:hypothetical protein
MFVFFTASGPTLWGPPSLLSNGYRGQSARSVKEATHLNLVPMCRILGAIPPLPHTPPWRGVKQPATLLASCIRGLLLDPEDGGSRFLWNVDELVVDYTVLHPKWVARLPFHRNTAMAVPLLWSKW